MKREDAGGGSGQQETARDNVRQEGGGPQAGTDHVPIWEADGAALLPSVLGPCCSRQHHQLKPRPSQAAHTQEGPAGMDPGGREQEQDRGPLRAGGGKQEHTHAAEGLLFPGSFKLCHNINSK